MKNTYDMAKHIYEIFTKDGKPHTHEPVDAVFIQVDESGYFNLSYESWRDEYAFYYPKYQVKLDSSKNEAINYIVADLNKKADYLNYERNNKAPPWRPNDPRNFI